MIFGSLAMLIVSGVLLAIGIGKSSVGYLVLSFLSACAAGLMLLAAYAVHRSQGQGTAAPAPAGGANGGSSLPAYGQQAMYVLVPASGNGGNGGAVSVAAPPIVDYESMTAEQVVKLVASGSLGAAQLNALRDYERAHQARKTVLDRLEKALAKA
jgi:hypothetical protein